MKRIVIAAAMSLCVVSLAAIASADTLIMRDGTRVQGTLVGIAGRTITFRHADGAARRYWKSQVEALEFVSAERANPRFLSGRSIETPARTNSPLMIQHGPSAVHSGTDGKSRLAYSGGAMKQPAPVVRRSPGSPFIHLESGLSARLARWRAFDGRRLRAAFSRTGSSVTEHGPMEKSLR